MTTGINLTPAAAAILGCLLAGTRYGQDLPVHKDDAILGDDDQRLNHDLQSSVSAVRELEARGLITDAVPLRPQLWLDWYRKEYGRDWRGWVLTPAGRRVADQVAPHQRLENELRHRAADPKTAERMRHHLIRRKLEALAQAVPVWLKPLISAGWVVVRAELPGWEPFLIYDTRMAAALPPAPAWALARYEEDQPPPGFYLRIDLCTGQQIVLDAAVSCTEPDGWFIDVMLNQRVTVLRIEVNPAKADVVDANGSWLLVRDSEPDSAVVLDEHTLQQAILDLIGATS